MKVKQQRRQAFFRSAAISMMTASAMFASAVRAAGPAWYDDSDPLQRAHAAFVEGRDLDMVNHVREVLMQEQLTEAEKSNVSDLMNQAFQSRGGSLPADWSLPADMPHFKAAVARTESPGDRVRYQMKVSGELAHEGALSDLKVTKYPDEVILHRQGQIGEWEDELWQGKHEFKGQTGKSNRAPDDGLYLVRFAMANGEVIEGWFVLSDASASASPVIRAPQPSATVDGPHPTLRYDRFRSPEYKGYEHVTVSAFLTRILPSLDEWDFVWGYWGENPDAGEIVLGRGSPYMDDHELAESLYYVTLNIREQYRFGEMRIARESRRAQAFSVDR